MKGLPRLLKAQSQTSKTGLLLFEQDVDLNDLPDFYIQKQRLNLRYAQFSTAAKTTGYYIKKDHIVFVLFKAIVPKTRDLDALFVVGDFNQWLQKERFKLVWDEHNQAWCLSLPKKNLPTNPFAFKFVSQHNQWIEPWENCDFQRDACGNKNLWVDFRKTGKHCVTFKTQAALSLKKTLQLSYEGKKISVDVIPWLDTFYSDKKLGVHLTRTNTSFALFAPRAQKIEVKVFNKDKTLYYPLTEGKNGIWSATIDQNFENYYYLYKIYTSKSKTIVDPYALQLKSPQGPGIITKIRPFKDNPFVTPALKDLSILEVHIRDLLAKSNVPQKGSLFTQLKAYFSQPNYVKNLGANCVELMPLTEFDTKDKTDYHWGYMPAHYFSLSSTYGTPQEFKACVETLHQQGLAVILDVVYNHMGIKNDLQKLDETYFLRHEANGILTNASGCGNDVRTESPMMLRLIIDSLAHFVKTYHIDGFRFDLAELIDLPQLLKIEQALRKIKKDVILIAEPWSFRKRIAYDLKNTSYSCWNDDYREFILQYVKGQGNCDGLKYFISGSTSWRCRFAQQSINYTESHDDFCWKDRLNGDEDLQRRQTHLMLAITCLSLGIPMLAEGQDFLRSKQHIRNTYNRGDLNALDYSLLEKNKSTHLYAKNLLKLRQSDLGDLLKIMHPTSGYFQYFYNQNTSALGILFNANFSVGKQQLLLLLNPHNFSVKFHFQGINTSDFVQIANTEYFVDSGNIKLTSTYEMQPVTCAIFVSS